MLNRNSRSNCLALWPSLNLCAQLSHKGSGYEGECGSTLKDILAMAMWEGRASPGLPPVYPLDYFAILPHASAESLRDAGASISHTAAPALPPTVPCK